MQNQAPRGIPGRRTLRVVFMLAGLGAPHSEDIPRTQRPLAWSAGWLGSGLGFMEQAWRGFVTLLHVECGDLTSQEHKPWAGVPGARPESIERKAREGQGLGAPTPPSPGPLHYQGQGSTWLCSLNATLHLLDFARAVLKTPKDLHFVLLLAEVH